MEQKKAGSVTGDFRYANAGCPSATPTPAGTRSTSGVLGAMRFGTAAAGAKSGTGTRAAQPQGPLQGRAEVVGRGICASICASICAGIARQGSSGSWLMWHGVVLPATATPTRSTLTQSALLRIKCTAATAAW